MNVFSDISGKTTRMIRGKRLYETMKPATYSKFETLLSSFNVNPGVFSNAMPTDPCASYGECVR